MAKKKTETDMQGSGGMRDSPISIKVASTRDIIEMLQEYEKENGIGAVVSIGRVGGGRRESEYRIVVANGAYSDKVADNGEYKETIVEIPSVMDAELFGNF